MRSVVRALLAAVLLVANFALVAFLAFGSYLFTADFMDRRPTPQFVLGRFACVAAIDAAFLGAAFLANRGFLRELTPDQPKLALRLGLVSAGILLAITGWGSVQLAFLM